MLRKHILKAMAGHHIEDACKMEDLETAILE